MYITRTSLISGLERSLDINITDQELARIKNGEHIQTVVPHLSPSDREFIKTGITAEEWAEAFPPEEDEEDDDDDDDDFDEERMSAMFDLDGNPR